MSEYLIEILEGEDVTHVVNVNIKNRKESTLSIASAEGYRHCTKFKNKRTAETVAKRHDNSRVVPSYGGFVNSSKSSVAPLTNKVNRTTPYRTI